MRDEPASAAHARGGVIELKLRDLAQIFNSMDPSPFRERDLDPKAEAFIVDWSLAYPAEQPLQLIVHLPEPPSNPELPAALSAAVAAHFANLAHVSRRELRTLFANGRTSLLIGLAFLALCTLASGLLGRTGDLSLRRFGAFGFEIAGWVAMWRPLEIFLYDWWPIRRKLRNHERLSRMRVTVVGPEPPPGSQTGISAGASAGSR